MKKSLSLLLEEFVSSSSKTPQYLNFHASFKREFTILLTQIGCTNIFVHKPNHFDVSGFFTAPNGQTWYFGLEDLRYKSAKNRLLIRTAKDYKDFEGGYNQYVSMTDNMIFNIQTIILKK